MLRMPPQKAVRYSPLTAVLRAYSTRSIQQTNLLKLVEDSLSWAVEEEEFNDAVRIRNLHLLNSKVYPNSLKVNRYHNNKRRRRTNEQIVWIGQHVFSA